MNPLRERPAARRLGGTDLDGVYAVDAADEVGDLGGPRTTDVALP